MERTCWNPQFDGTLMEWFDPGFLEEPFLIRFYGGKKYVKYGRAFGREARCGHFKRKFILAEIFCKFKCMIIKEKSLRKIATIQTANA